MKPFNELTPAEVERLALVAEECGEVIHIIGKVLRHGYESCHPDGGPENRHLLECEIGDLVFALDFLTEHDLTPGSIVRATNSKRERVWKYFHEQRAPTTGETK